MIWNFSAMLPCFRFIQVLTAAKLVLYEVYEIVYLLQATYLEATECEKELVQNYGYFWTKQWFVHCTL